MAMTGLGSRMLSGRLPGLPATSFRTVGVGFRPRMMGYVPCRSVLQWSASDSGVCRPCGPILAPEHGARTEVFSHLFNIDDLRHPLTNSRLCKETDGTGLTVEGCRDLTAPRRKSFPVPACFDQRIERPQVAGHGESTEGMTERGEDCASFLRALVRPALWIDLRCLPRSTRSSASIYPRSYRRWHPS